MAFPDDRRVQKVIPFIEAVFFVFLGGFIVYLLINNYQAQVKLRSSAAEYYLQYVREHADDISRFFDKLRGQLQSLAQDRALTGYYENKALGMSLEYGLKASLIGIESKARSVFEEGDLCHGECFGSLFILEENGSALAQMPAVAAAFSVDRFAGIGRAQKSEDGGFFHLTTVSGVSAVDIVVPYFFKEKYVGDVIAKVNNRPLIDIIFSETSAGSWEWAFLRRGTDALPLFVGGDHKGHLAELETYDRTRSAMRTNPSFVVMSSTDGRGQLLVYDVPVERTPFHFVIAVPEAVVWGKGDPRHVLYVLWAVAVFFGMALIILWHFYVRNIVLQSQYDAQREFTSTVSHELRTPLAAMKSSIDILDTGTPGPLTNDQKMFLKRVKQNIDRLARLINDILDLSKLESGKMLMTFAPVCPLMLVREVADAQTASIRARGIELALDLPEISPRIQADKDRLTQVLNNLINNAVKFTKEGSITISLSCFVGKQVVFCVRDTGMGISKENQKKLFRKFQQISASQQVGGTGLGLAISKEIVERHRGRIWVESRVDEGSAFFFSIPV